MLELQQQPLLPEVGVIALVPDHWSPLWQPRHYVLSKLAQYFHVVWVSPAPEWRGAFRNSNNHVSHDTDEFCPPGLIVYKPEFWLPRLYRPEWLAKLIFDARVKRARQRLISRGCRKIILYLWRPEFSDALNSIPHDLSCYHIDDEYSFAQVDVPPDPEEMALIGKVDQVFIHSPGLLERKGKLNPKTQFIPNGVDYDAYAKLAPEPEDLVDIPRPRVGYTGWIKRQ